MKPKASSEMDKLEDQFKKFDENIKDMTLDRMNEARKEEVEPQTKLSQKELEKSKDIYLKPKRTIASKEKFDEKFREAYNYAKEYVRFIAENKEIIGEDITLWTKPFAGLPAEEWVVPTNKPIYGPRYLAEQIEKCKYHRFSMQNTMTGTDGTAQYFGNMVVDNIIHRLDAKPVSTQRSFFMSNF